jgi:hypothetical protein
MHVDIGGNKIRYFNAQKCHMDSILPLGPDFGPLNSAPGTTTWAFCRGTKPTRSRPCRTGSQTWPPSTPAASGRRSKASAARDTGT